MSLFHADHDFDELVLDHDAKSVSMSDVAMFYHIQAHRNFLQASPAAAARKSEYSERFFGPVLAELEKRGLVGHVLSIPLRNATTIPLDRNSSSNTGSDSSAEGNAEDSLLLASGISNATPQGSRQPPPSRADMKWTNYSVVFDSRFE